MNRISLLSTATIAAAAAFTLAPGVAGASTDEPTDVVVDAVIISAPVDEVPSFGNGPIDAPADSPTVEGPVDVPVVDAPIEAQTGGPVDAPVVVDDAETISAPVEDAETISAPVGEDDGAPVGLIAAGAAVAAAAIGGAAAVRRNAQRQAAAT